MLRGNYIQSSIIKIGNNAICVIESETHNSNSDKYTINYLADLNNFDTDCCEAIAFDTYFIGSKCPEYLALEFLNFEFPRSLLNNPPKDIDNCNVEIVDVFNTYNNESSLTLHKVTQPSGGVCFGFTPLTTPSPNETSIKDALIQGGEFYPITNE